MGCSHKHTFKLKMSASAKCQDIGFDEDIVIAKSSNADDMKFDQTIGAIEEIIMEPKFQDIQDQFMNKNYKHFEDNDENKLIYTTIHNEYISLIEKYLETHLKRKIPGFSMNDFMKNLLSRREELEGEIFELLLTFEDFLEFKMLMLNFRAEKEGRNLDMSLGMCIQSINIDSSSKSNSKSEHKKNTPLLDNAQMDQFDSDH